MFRTIPKHAHVSRCGSFESCGDARSHPAAFERELMRGRYGPVLESIAGPANNDVDVSGRWNLSRHAGQALRIYLVDASTDKWGFVSVSEMTLSEPLRAR